MDVAGTTLGNLLLNLAPAAIAAGVSAKRRRYTSYKGYPRSKRHRSSSSRFYGQFQDRKELNFFDTAITTAPVETWLPLTSLNLVPQGTAESTRIGRQIFVKSIHIRGLVQLNEDGTGKDECLFRWALVQDRQANGANPAATDLWELNDLVTHRNLAQIKRFSILRTGQMQMNRTGSAGTEAVRSFILNYRFPAPQPVEFNSTAGAITEIQSNNFVFMYCRTVLDGTQVMSIDLTSRLRYTS